MMSIAYAATLATRRADAVMEVGPGIIGSGLADGGQRVGWQGADDHGLGGTASMS